MFVYVLHRPLSSAYIELVLSGFSRGELYGTYVGRAEQTLPRVIQLLSMPQRQKVAVAISPF